MLREIRDFDAPDDQDQKEKRQNPVPILHIARKKAWPNAVWCDSAGLADQFNAGRVGDFLLIGVVAQLDGQVSVTDGKRAKRLPTCASTNETTAAKTSNSLALSSIP